MATGRIPDPNSAPITAKGDLYTYSTVPARLAVGSNGDTLVADSSATTGLRWSPAPSTGNPVINSAFQVWQRGTSISVAGASDAYTADRWRLFTQSGQACTVSRQATNDTTNLPNIQYCARVQRNSGQTGTGQISFIQGMETLDSIPYAGKTVTVSFYARAGANYSSASNAFNFLLYSGTGTDQFPTAYTGGASVATATVTLTTTWQRFTVTGTIATTATELGLYPYFSATGTAGAADYYELTGVQIDLGSVALPFRTQNSTIQGELAACQRYYFRATGQTTTYYTMTNMGFARNTTIAYIPFQVPVTMRAMSSLEYANIRAVRASTDVGYTSGTFTFTGNHTLNIAELAYTHGTGIFTQGENVYLGNNNSASAYIAISGEL
jgi:hypothetical protein